MMNGIGVCRLADHDKHGPTEHTGHHGDDVLLPDPEVEGRWWRGGGGGMIKRRGEGGVPFSLCKWATMGKNSTINPWEDLFHNVTLWLFVQEANCLSVCLSVCLSLCVSACLSVCSLFVSLIFRDICDISHLSVCPSPFLYCPLLHPLSVSGA